MEFIPIKEEKVDEALTERLESDPDEGKEVTKNNLVFWKKYEVIQQSV